VAPAAYAHGFEERRVPEVANVRRSSGRIHPTEHRQDIGNVIDKREQSSDCAPQYERIAIWDRSTDIGDMDNRLFDPFTGLGAAAGCRNGATVQDQESFKTRRSDPQAGFRSSTALDPELFRGTALLACEREILEFPAEQNWFDTDNDHFRSAVRTCRRSSYFEWRFWNSHVISFRRSEGDRDAEGSQ
jgi:hypothetical protein